MANYSGPYQGNDLFKSFTKTWHTEPYKQISPTRPELSAKGNVVFITGGSTGIGKATAVAFAQAGAAAVAIFGRRKEKLEAAAEVIQKAATSPNFKAIIGSVDLSKSSATSQVFFNALRQSGGAKIDIFISNAASAPQFSQFIGYAENEVREKLGLNILGTFNAVQAAVPLLEADANIFDVTSGIAHLRHVSGCWLYASFKAMNTKMFTYIQADNPGWRVVSIQPGVVATELSAGSSFAAQDEVELPAQFQVWLASPEADFLKGKLVWVNWDVDELKSIAGEVKDSALLEISLNGVQCEIRTPLS